MDDSEPEWERQRNHRAARRLFESLVTVAEITSQDLFTLAPDMGTREALAALTARGFDQAPVADDEIRRHVTLEHLEDPHATIDEVAVPIEAADLVAASTGLAAVIPRLGQRPYLYVLGPERVEGIVTRADLQLPPVSMAVLGVVVSVELALNALIAAYLGDGWPELLPPKMRDEIRGVFDQERRRHTELTELECMSLRHRLELVRRCDALRSDLGYATRRAVGRTAARLIALRNAVAHGRRLFVTRSSRGGGRRPGEPGDAEGGTMSETIAAIDEALDLADRAWALVAKMRH